MITSEIIQGINSGALDETGSNDLLREKILDILTNYPSIWIQNDVLPQEPYWKILGFKNTHDLESAKPEKINNGIQILLLKLITTNKNINQSRINQTRVNDLIIASYSLTKMVSQKKLGKNRFIVDNLYSVLDKKFLLTNTIYKLVSYLRVNLPILFKNNFPDLLPYSIFTNNLNKLRLIEVTRDEILGDYISLSYVICPNNKNIYKPYILFNNFEKSISKELHYSSFFGEGYFFTASGGCGFFKLDTVVCGRHLLDPKAWVIKTRFPSNTPLLDQVYQIIGYELEYLLNISHPFHEIRPKFNSLSQQYLEMSKSW